jgi:NAD(P)-dependent dehydrogenase (short-subunit alcohol dehydrogenase family)
MMGAYASSKAAVDLLTDALRRELRPCGVRVVLVRPGQTATRIYDTAEAEAVQRLDGAITSDGYDYQPRLRRFQHLMNRSRRLRVKPERVARRVVRIYFRRFPRPRYNIGWDAKAAAIVDRLIPPRLVDWIISWRLRAK